MKLISSTFIDLPSIHLELYNLPKIDFMIKKQLYLAFVEEIMKSGLLEVRKQNYEDGRVTYALRGILMSEEEFSNICECIKNGDMIKLKKLFKENNYGR